MRRSLTTGAIVSLVWWYWPAAPLTAQESSAPPVLEFGSGEFLADPGSQSDGQSDTRLDQPFSATYSAADIRTVANEIIGEVLGLNFTVAPDVTGQVTMRIENAQSRRAVLEALRSGLQPNGAAVVDRDDFIAIVRSDQSTMPTRPATMRPGAPPPPGGGVAIITPQNISAGKLAELLLPFVSSEAIALVDEQRRILIVRGDEATLETASQTAALFDVDWFSRVSTGTFQLDNISPSDIVAEISSVMGESASGAEFIPLERLSSLIVLAPNPDTLHRVETWVERLDVPSLQVASDMLIYEARHLSAEELATSVRELGDNNDSINSSGQSSVLPQQAAAGTQRIIESIDPTVRETSESRSIAVSVNLSRNVVIVRGDPDQLAAARLLLQSLDQAQTQVLIEAAIIEVTLNDEFEFGINWSGVEDRLTATFSDVASGLVTSKFPGAAISYVNTDIEAAISLLSSITNIDVVSRPSVVALNNQTANLQVGDQVPIVTQSAVSVIDPAAPIVNQTEYRDTGVILNVTPSVRSGGLVELEIEQEASQVARTTSSGIDSPTIQQRKIASKLLVPSGQSVALGGLISTSKTSIVTGVPVLKSIPLLGQLFRSNSDFVERTELIVFLTPRVLYDPREAVEATDQLRAAFHRLEEELAPR